MKSNIRKIGNSKGVVLPPAFLAEWNLDKDSDIDIILRSDGILIKPVTNPREGWEDTFMEAIRKGEVDEGDMSDGLSNEFDDEEWTW